MKKTIIALGAAGLMMTGAVQAQQFYEPNETPSHRLEVLAMAAVNMAIDLKIFSRVCPQADQPGYRAWAEARYEQLMLMVYSLDKFRSEPGKTLVADMTQAVISDGNLAQLTPLCEWVGQWALMQK